MSIFLFLALCANQYASADTSNVCGVSGVLRRPGGPTHYARSAANLQQEIRESRNAEALGAEESIISIIRRDAAPVTSPGKGTGSPRIFSGTIRRSASSASLALGFVLVFSVPAARTALMLRPCLLLSLLWRTRLVGCLLMFRPCFSGAGLLRAFLLSTRLRRPGFGRTRLVGPHLVGPGLSRTRFVGPCLIGSLLILALERLEVLLLPDVVLRSRLWTRIVARLSRAVFEAVRFLWSWLPPIRLGAIRLHAVRLGAIRLRTIRLRPVRLVCASRFIGPRAVDSRHRHSLRMPVVN